MSWTAVEKRRKPKAKLVVIEREIVPVPDDVWQRDFEPIHQFVYNEIKRVGHCSSEQLLLAAHKKPELGATLKKIWAALDHPSPLARYVEPVDKFNWRLK